MSIWVDANGWPIPPTVLLGCLVAEILYFRGWRVLVRAEQAKRAASQWNSWFWRGTYFLGAILILLLASSAPIDTLSSRLLWVHMIQHLLLLVVIAPLLVAAAPLLPLWLGLPRRARRLVKAVVKPNAWRAFSRIGQAISHLTSPSQTSSVTRLPCLLCAVTRSFWLSSTRAVKPYAH